MRSSKADLEKALTGKLTAHHRFMLRQIYAHMAYLEGQIALIDKQIKDTLSADEALLTMLTEIPDVGLKSAIQTVRRSDCIRSRDRPQQIPNRKALCQMGRHDPWQQ